MPQTHTVAPGDFAVANVDLEHHMKFVGTTSNGKVPSPVEMVKAGKLPVGYLEQFGADSAFHQDILEYKATLVGRS